jgi:hypothetical protein
MTTIRSAQTGILVSLTLMVGLGLTAAEACDPRVTTQPRDVWDASPTRVVRDHRDVPVIRDHRDPYGSPTVRDHRTPRDMSSGGVTVTSSPRSPIVRDHRTGPFVRDHRR